MQGIFINGRRPKSKKEIKEQVERINLAEEHGFDPAAIGHLAAEAQRSPADFDPYSVVLEATSLHGDEFDGSLSEAMRTNNYGPFQFVGPDPYKDRKFYGTLQYTNYKWVVK